jgi:hypothetical protein
LFDEALPLLRGAKEGAEEQRGYLCIAMDPYGDNYVFKKLVDHLPEQALRYPARAAIVMFFQPGTVLYDRAVRPGLMRRLYINYLKRKTPIEQIYHQRLQSTGNMDEYAQQFAERVGMLVQEGTWTFSNNAMQAIEEYSVHLYYIGCQHSKKGRAYTQLIAQTLMDMLLKLSCILAGSMGQSNIEREHVQLAFMDAVEIHCNTLDYIRENVVGDMTEQWNTSDEKEATCLSWLYEHGGANEQSSTITIGEFIAHIATVFSYTLENDYRGSMAHKRYLDFVKRNLVGSKQVGAHHSKVWLAFTPKNDVYHEGGKGAKGRTAYDEICKQVSAIVENIAPPLPMKQRDAEG